MTTGSHIPRVYTTLIQHYSVEKSVCAPHPEPDVRGKTCEYVEYVELCLTTKKHACSACFAPHSFQNTRACVT